MRKCAQCTAVQQGESIYLKMVLGIRLYIRHFGDIYILRLIKQLLDGALCGSNSFSMRCAC